MLSFRLAELTIDRSVKWLASPKSLARRFSVMLLAMLGVASLVGSSQAEAPYIVDWVRQFGDNSYAEHLGVAVQGGESVFAAGKDYSFPGGIQPVGVNGALRKLSSTGDPQWSSYLGTEPTDTFTDVFVGGEEGVYASGWTAGALQGANAGVFDSFLSKYDFEGNLQWTRQFGTPASDQAHGIVANGMGSVFVVGETAGSLSQPQAGVKDAFLRKYDSDGSLEWSRQFGTSQADELVSVAADNSGNVVGAGNTAGSLAGPNAGGTTSVYDGFLTKYDASGAVQWSKQFGTSDLDIATGVAVDGDDSVFVTGYTMGALGAPSAGGMDAILLKYDSSGGLLWTRQLGTSTSDDSRGIVTDPEGNAYITGRTQGVLGTASAGRDDIFVSKYDPAGVLLWTTQIGTPWIDIGQGITIDANGRVFVVGTTGGPFDQAGSGQAFVARLSEPIPEPGAMILAAAGVIILPFIRLARTCG